MNNKIICISIISMFLLIGLTTLSAIGIKIENNSAEDSICYLSDNNLYSNLDESVFSSRYNKPVFVPGEMIIRFNEPVNVCILESPSGSIITSIDSVDNLNNKYDVISFEKLLKENSVHSLSTVYKFVFSDDVDIISIAEEYNNDPNVDHAEPNYIYEYCLEPNDPYFKNGDQWALDNIAASAAWDTTTGSSDVVIAILDSGVDYNHPDIADNIWVNPGEDLNHNGVVDDSDFDGIDNDGNGYVDDIRGWDFTTVDANGNGKLQDNDPMDVLGHGTHCAGIVAAVANNGIGISGVCWNSKIMPLKAGDYWISIWSAVDAIYYAIDNGADVISMSWGGYEQDSWLERVFNEAYEAGVVLIAAAGNEHTMKRHYPAGYSTVIAVTATNEDDGRPCFSNFGSWVDVAAPGVDILSLRASGTDMYGDGSHIVDEQYYLASGTSMACPHVAGVAALILSNAKIQNMDLNPAEVATVIRSSTDIVSSSVYIGIGRINAYMAVQKTAAVVADFGFGSWQDDMETWGNDEYLNFQVKDGSKYVLEWGRGIYPNSWTVIDSGIPEDSKTTHNYFFDSEVFDEGLHTFRLRIDNTHEDRVLRVVNNEYDTFHVDDSSGADYKHIQDAINDAGFGDTVYVHKGTYFENVYISRSIALHGEDRDSTIIYGDMSDSYGISIRAIPDYPTWHRFGAEADKTIKGLTISNHQLGGIEIIGANTWNDIPMTSDYKISDNIISDNTAYGIYVHCSPNIVISNNIIKNTKGLPGDGIITKGNPDQGVSITDNVFKNNVHSGINLAGASSIVFGNNFYQSLYGIYSDKFVSAYNTIYHNNFKENTYNAYDEGDNTWYDETLKEGNYWDDYEGKDRNSDGIGDSAYITEPRLLKNNDKYPHISPYDNGENQPLIVDAGGPYKGKNNADMHFYGAVSGGAPSYSYSWDFDDSDGIQEDSTDQNPIYTYATDDTYTITLTVTDSNSDTASDTAEVTITKDKSANLPCFNFLQRLVDRFPLLERLLKLPIFTSLLNRVVIK